MVNELFQAIERRGYVLVQSGMSFLHSAPVAFQDCDNKGGFCRKVMVNAGFSNLNRVGDVGIAESREASFYEETMGYIHDPFCCIAAHTTSDYLLVGLVAKILGKIRMLGHFATVARTGRSMVIGAWSEIRS